MKCRTPGRYSPRCGCPYCNRKRRELVGLIAHEAHTMGRLYSAGGEKRMPGDEWARVEKMANESLRQGRVVVQWTLGTATNATTLSDSGQVSEVSGDAQKAVDVLEERK